MLPSSRSVRLGCCAVEAALDALADDEHRRRRAVIGAEAAVLFDAASELGEDHHRDFVGAPDALEVFDEAAHGVGGVHEQPAVEIGLLHVRVERVALIGDVVQARRHPGGDERRDALEVAAQPAADPVVHRRAIARRRLAHEVGALGRVLRPSTARNSSVAFAVARGWLSSASTCFSASVPSRRKRAGIVEDQRRMPAASHRERLRVAEVHDHVARRRVVASRRPAGRAIRAARRRSGTPVCQKPIDEKCDRLGWS